MSSKSSGNPVDGWTLESFAGQAFPQNPGLLTELFVDLRNAVLAPQTAAWNIFESIFTGPGAPTITSIGDSLLTNTENVGEALLNLPGSVITDIGTEVQNLFADVSGERRSPLHSMRRSWGWFSNKLFRSFRDFSFLCRFVRAH